MMRRMMLLDIIFFIDLIVFFSMVHCSLDLADVDVFLSFSVVTKILNAIYLGSLFYFNFLSFYFTKAYIPVMFEEKWWQVQTKVDVSQVV